MRYWSSGRPQALRRFLLSTAILPGSALSQGGVRTKVPAESFLALPTAQRSPDRRGHGSDFAIGITA